MNVAAADFQFTMTQKSPDCSVIVDGAESKYTPLSTYAKSLAPNVKTTVTIPFADYKLNVKGAPYDIVHFKDFTFVKMAPLNSIWKFYNFRLVSNCTQVTSTTNSTTSPVPSTKSSDASHAALPLGLAFLAMSFASLM